RAVDIRLFRAVTFLLRELVKLLVRVLRSVKEASLPVPQLPLEITNRPPRRFRVRLVLRRPVKREQVAQELRVVLEHLLVVRLSPVPSCGIAEESAPFPVEHI